MQPAPTASATLVLLWNKRTLCGIRSSESRAFPGFLAFPGGAVDKEDARLPLYSGQDAERAAALRETGEETGRWWLCHQDGAPPRQDAAAAFVANLRRGIAEALMASELVFDDRTLVALGRWITPGFILRRFSVRQFLMEVDGEAPIRTEPTDELLDIGWRAPADIRGDHRRGDVLLLPPIRFVIDGLCCTQGRRLHQRLSDAPPADKEKLRDIITGIAVQPQRTPTLLPATHTNCVLVGSGDFLIVDPATPYDDERERFDGLMAELQAQGRRPVAIAITHHHRDHVGDVARVAEKYGLAVWAHEDTRSLVDFPIDRSLHDGEEIDLGGTPHRRLRVLYTPGHAHGHLCFYEVESQTLIAADIIASIGSILIDPPEGHMATYMATLDRLIELNPRRVVPSHGPLLADGSGRLRLQKAHRLARQARVEAALLALGSAAASSLVSVVYGDEIPEDVYPLAARSIEAALEWMCEKGEATRSADGFVAN